MNLRSHILCFEFYNVQLTSLIKTAIASGVSRAVETLRNSFS